MFLHMFICTIVEKLIKMFKIFTLLNDNQKLLLHAAFHV